MHTDKTAAGVWWAQGKRLPFWSAVVLHRFYHRIATAIPSSKAPEGWRSPKPGGSSHGSWKASPETKIRAYLLASAKLCEAGCQSVVEKFRCYDFKKRQ
jgi:hypothetical protein